MPRIPYRPRTIQVEPRGQSTQYKALTGNGGLPKLESPRLVTERLIVLEKVELMTLLFVPAGSGQKAGGGGYLDNRA